MKKCKDCEAKQCWDSLMRKDYIIMKLEKVIKDMAEDLMGSMTSTGTVDDIIKHYKQLNGLIDRRISNE